MRRLARSALLWVEAALSVVAPTPPPRRPEGLRLWLYPLLVLAASCALGAAQRDPQDDVDDLAVILRATDERLFHRSGGANVGVFPRRGWSLTVYVGDTRRYGPGSFLVLTKVDGRLTGELLGEPEGGEGALRQWALTGAALETYLRRSGLDLSGLDAACVARFGVAPPPR